ncbi:MAG TPA: DUF1801 domain-containing protein [Crocinitomicaceae bacterium]|nr:DUF1801 domain-containing protein [Crocinitomicaceae bacterium]
MLKSLDNFYVKTEEPLRSTLMALSDIILSQNEKLSSSLKYGMPFFSYNKKMFCYLWVDKKTKEPYIGVVEGNKINHPSLEQGNRKRMKIFRIDSQKDLPIDEISEVLQLALLHY